MLLLPEEPNSRFPQGMRQMASGLPLGIGGGGTLKGQCIYRAEDVPEQTTVEGPDIKS